MGISKETANETLWRAYEIAVTGKDSDSKNKALVDTLLDNTHLTYKYILFTALLSKATDSEINPLCLQVKSELPGAYDARTICHKVIVPFEMETLEKALGGSNEPFLNKPARFPELAKTNAVRRGNDQFLLNTLCDKLPLIRSSEEAFNTLVYLLQKLICIRATKKEKMTFSIPHSADEPSVISRFLISLMEESFEGETLTLAVAGAYHLLFATEDTIVEVHPVNQCGASSREVSDLDIYQSGELDIANELKDKEYFETDVRHAADKVMSAGGAKMLFIEGPRAHCNPEVKRALCQEYAERNFLLVILPAYRFIDMTVALSHNIDAVSMMTFLFRAGRDTKFKDECMKYLESRAKDQLGLNFV